MYKIITIKKNYTKRVKDMAGFKIKMTTCSKYVYTLRTRPLARQVWIQTKLIDILITIVKKITQN